MDSEEEFAARKEKSTARLHRSVQPLRPGGGAGGGRGEFNSVLRTPANQPHDPADYAEADRREEERRRAGVHAAGGAQVHGPGGHAKEGDVQPMAIDGSVGWDKVGGLGKHVDALREMVLMPLLYPEVFERLGVTPPRGV
eukprot:6122636-Prymnesium_polylepis.1